MRETKKVYIIYRILNLESTLISSNPHFDLSQYKENQAKLVEELSSPKQENTDVENEKSRYTNNHLIIYKEFCSIDPATQ